MNTQDEAVPDVPESLLLEIEPPKHEGYQWPSKCPDPVDVASKVRQDIGEALRKYFRNLKK